MSSSNEAAGIASTSRSEWKVAAIGAAASVLIAFITTMGTIWSTSPRIREASGELEKISAGISEQKQVLATLDRDSVPIGSIVASLLPPAKFYESVGDSSVFDPKVNRWVLADKSKDITLSRYGQMMNVVFTPDLRGVFLRGIDSGRADLSGDPDGERAPGSFQSDELAAHDHQLTQKALVHKAFAIPGDVPSEDLNPGAWAAHVAIRTTVAGGQETRPKNVAVYYYVRIN